MAAEFVLRMQRSPDDASVDVVPALADNVEALAAWVEHRGDFRDAAETFDEAYQGRFGNETAFAEELFEGIGWGEAMEAAGVPVYYFDMEAWARDLFMSDYLMDGGHVFRTDV